MKWRIQKSLEKNGDKSVVDSNGSELALPVSSSAVTAAVA